jgi:hypothetical protein
VVTPAFFLPLWKRALLARGSLQGQRACRVGRPGGRIHARPSIGDKFGNVMVTGEVELPPGGRRDARFEIVCLHCGATGVAFEANLRERPPRCADGHRGPRPKGWEHP